MSRTTRVGPVEGFWSTVDEWAATTIEPNRIRAWWRSQGRLDATGDPYLDVTGDPAPLARRPRRLRDAIGARGLALTDDDAVRAALVDAGVEHRRVEAARRYRWNGPALTPVVLELHTGDDEAVVEAWWEDVWAAWPKIRLGREPDGPRSPRRATATAQITRLLDALGHDPLGHP